MLDLGLPDGSGVELIRELRKAEAWVPGIVAVSGDDGGSARSEAMEEGASCFLAKPLVDIACFQQVIRALVDQDVVPKPFVPQVVNGCLRLDAQAFVDDLGHVGQQLDKALQGNDRNKLRYLAQFTRSIAQTAQDHELMDSASAFMARLRGGHAWHKAGAQVLAQVRNRLIDTPAI
jgi:DNA-binding response OmpR family regulator